METSVARTDPSSPSEPANMLLTPEHILLTPASRPSLADEDRRQVDLTSDTTYTNHNGPAVLTNEPDSGIIEPGSQSAQHLQHGTLLDLRRPRNPLPLYLTVIVPAHNEQSTLFRTVSSLLALSLPCPHEIIVVDDGSTDDTQVILRRMKHPRLSVIQHDENRGKGAAVLTGLGAATGSHVLIFDADAEYEPADISTLLGPLLRNRCSVVFGSRRFGHYTSYDSFRYALGNVGLTFVANLLFDSVITDLHTCLKLVPTHFLKELELTERGFGLDTEITAELLRRGIRPFEVPISYVARSRSEGKKITWKDGVKCLVILVRVRLRGNVRTVQLDLRSMPVPRSSELAFDSTPDLRAR